MPVSFSMSTLKPNRQKSDVLVLPIFGKQKINYSLPVGLKRELTAAIKRRKFSGEAGSTLFITNLKGAKAPFLALIGLGVEAKDKDEQTEAMRRGISATIVDARRHGLSDIAVVVDDSTDLAAAIVDGVLLSTYRFSQYSKKLRKESAQSIKRCTIIVSKDAKHNVAKAVNETRRIHKGVILARDLVNQPAANMSPKTLVDAALEIAGRSPEIDVKIINAKQAAELGFNAFLAVARGSIEEPYVIHLIKKPAQPITTPKKIFIVGKGITFDSGGLSLKPADSMEDMKIDMAGAATVLGAFSVIEKMDLPIEVHGVIATCENMPSGTAYRPGDVLTAKNGTTIEIGNTDAEGRVTLADALSYATEFKPDAIIDLATLTGACVVALGDTVAGLWSNNDDLTRSIIMAARKSGEDIWRMPLVEDLRPIIEGQVADLSNSQKQRIAGAITAALFLREFVGKTPWAHLDIAGPSYADRSTMPYFSKGATGYGVRTLVELLSSYRIPN